MTLHKALAGARERLVSAGISRDEASIDVDLYARTILEWDRATLLSELQQPAPTSLEPMFSEWVARRELHEPSAYIIGIREFWGLDLEVTPAVLIPRPETELIVEEATALLRTNPPTSAAGRGMHRVADVGTGSGCVAISIATELPECHVIASDISPDALAVARRNALRHGVASRVEFVETSYLNGVAGPFDLIAANPPYVKDGDRRALGRGVLYEPAVALFGGSQGLRDISGVLATTDLLVPGGYLVMEFGLGQEEDVIALLKTRSDLHLEKVRCDLQGIDRTAIIRRR
ncbi:MAG: peptide chain release factor N(5)-glutamine methyltransferase [Acidobacteria bacterium]|nr:peptide chain release factor N(5)-glutamine methyltransferase [Acidobacteriota bacterium]